MGDDFAGVIIIGDFEELLEGAEEGREGIDFQADQ